MKLEFIQNFIDKMSNKLKCKKYTKRFQLKGLRNNNQIIGVLPKMKKSEISINGENNLIYFDKGVELINTSIKFKGNNSLVFLKSGLYNNLEISIFNNSVLYIGENNYFNPNGSLNNLILSEGKNIFIGRDNLFSLGFNIRNADPHLIYNIENRERINLSKSIYIGDHVWLGQNSLLLKGSQIHSGSIVGANSVLANKKVLSNCIFGGNPAKLLKKDIFWDPHCVHSWTPEVTKKYYKNNDDTYIYEYEENKFLSFDQIECDIENIDSAYDKYLYLSNLSVEKNRFTMQ